MEKTWHSLSLDAIFQLLGTDEKGLASGEVGNRLKKYGANILPKEKPYSKIRLFLSQFNNPLIFILLVAGGLSLYLGHYSDTVFIAVVLLINTSVGFYQENKANASLQALRSMVKFSARVIRDGNLKEVDSSELAPGDIIYLKMGDKAPSTDARLIWQKGLSVDESSLTGEWLAVSKSIGEISENSPLADRTNMVHAGTIVEYGSTTAVVVETGLATAIGGIVLLLKETKERKTPLQEKYHRFQGWLDLSCLPLSYSSSF